MVPDVFRFTTPEMKGLVARWTSAGPDGGLEAAIDAVFLSTLSDADVGQPYTFMEQHGGRLVHDVRPQPGLEQTISSQGRVPFLLHTDDAFLAATARPQRLALLGLRNPSGVPTVIVGLNDVLNLMTPTAIAGLRRPHYEFGCPDSFALNGETPFSSWPRPVLRRSDSRYKVALATRTRATESGPPDAGRHLDELRSAVEAAPRTEVLLAPGEILVVSNSRCLHGRGPIDGDRWLKRAYLRDDLVALDAVSSTSEPRVYSALTAFRSGERGRPEW